MKVECLKQLFENSGMKFLTATFLEDGYEIRVRLNPTDDSYSPQSIERESEIRKNMKKLDEIDYQGLVLVETSIVKDTYNLVLVPTSMEEMTDFIWKYVERYGKREDKLSDILGDAFCVLEKAIASIPNSLSEAKKAANDNFEKFTSMIF